MLDTRARKKVEFIFDMGAKFFVNLGMTPTQVTVIAMVTGILAAVLFYFGFEVLSVAALWFSGYLDAVDGNMARRMNRSTKLGTLMDILFDRMVEVSIIIAIALRFQDAALAMVILSVSIIISMTIFLTTGALAENTGKKSFRYQAGLMERTEGFIMFTLIILFPVYATQLGFLFAALIAFTAVQRFLDAFKILR